MSNTAADDIGLWLGAPETDTPLTAESSSSTPSLYDCKIGGQPVWMFPLSASPSTSSTTVIKCPTCKSPNDLTLLSQVCAPLFNLDRLLYVFVCRKCAKANPKHPEKAIAAYRCQNYNEDTLKQLEEERHKKEKQQQKSSLKTLFIIP